MCSEVTQVYTSLLLRVDQAILCLRISVIFDRPGSCRWHVIDALDLPMFLSAAQNQLIWLKSKFRLGPPAVGPVLLAEAGLSEAGPFVPGRGGGSQRCGPSARSGCGVLLRGSAF